MVKDSAQIIQLENANLRQRILTPITSIYSQIDDLKEVLATDTQSLADLDKVSNGCDRLKSLINALMDSGGISSSKRIHEGGAPPSSASATAQATTQDKSRSIKVLPLQKVKMRATGSPMNQTFPCSAYASLS